MSQPGDLERIRLDVDAELAMLASGRPPGPTADDVTDLDAYEVRLRSLHESVLAVEEIEQELDDT